MDISTHRARITGPVSYRAKGGPLQHIPMGPCLVESLGSRTIDIVWGAQGQRSAELTIEALTEAQDHGHLVLLD